MVTGNQTLSERLARSLTATAELWQSRTTQHHKERVERQEELDALLAYARDLDSFRQRHRAAVAAKRDLEEEIQALELETSATGDEVSQLEASLAETLERLQEQCRRAAGDLPLLDPTETAQWVQWLERWHVDHKRPFENTTGWNEYFAKRKTVGHALFEWQPLLDQIDQLEVEIGADGLRRSDLPHRVTEVAGDVSRLEGEIQRMLETVGDRYGRILEDLPDPQPNDPEELLRCYEGLLSYLEGILGRFAAATLVESVTLEVLA